jgi:hypothetical protein
MKDKNIPTVLYWRADEWFGHIKEKSEITWISL